jgi:hypothetical protein
MGVSEARLHVLVLLVQKCPFCLALQLLLLPLSSLLPSSS